MSGCIDFDSEPVHFRGAGEGEVSPVLESLAGEVDLVGAVGGESVLVKPNQLTKTKPGVTTSAEVLEAVVELLEGVVSEVVVGETDTNGRSFGYATSGIDVDVPVVNLSESESRVVEGRHGSLELPVEALEMEVVDVPVPKTHGLTGYTGGVKNLFGLLQRSNKEVLHHRIDGVLCDLYSAVDPAVTFLDGLYVMRSGGPSRGEVVEGGFLGASRDALSADLAVLRASGLEVSVAPYLEHVAGSSEVELEGEVPVLDFDPPRVGFLQAFGSQVQRISSIGPVSRAVAAFNRMI